MPITTSGCLIGRRRIVSALTRSSPPDTLHLPSCATSSKPHEQEAVPVTTPVKGTPALTHTRTQPLCTKPAFLTSEPLPLPTKNPFQHLPHTLQLDDTVTGGGEPHATDATPRQRGAVVPVSGLASCDDDAAAGCGGLARCPTYSRSCRSCGRACKTRSRAGVMCCVV
jgi:hypothetical protein